LKNFVSQFVGKPVEEQALSDRSMCYLRVSWTVQEKARTNPG